MALLALWLHAALPALAATSARPLTRGQLALRTSSPPSCSLRPSNAAAWVALSSASIGAIAVLGANSCFGILDQTADELADIFGVDEVPSALTAAVQAARPIYEPIKAVSPSCTDAVFPEFNALNDFNDCLLLKQRLFWRNRLAPPIIIDQRMRMSTIWQQSTGSSVWGGGVVLARHMEELGSNYFIGKEVLELGTGAGLGAITAAKLGASSVLATDRDASVLELTSANAATNLGADRAKVSTATLEWGQPNDLVDGRSWDLVIGADLTYNRASWPFLFQQLKLLRAPTILSASERRADELQELKAALDDAGFSYRVVDSPMHAGYASSNVKLFEIGPYTGVVDPATLPDEDEAPLTNAKLAAMSPEARAKALSKAKMREKASLESIARIAEGAVKAR